jgi:hypothetical protein
MRKKLILVHGLLFLFQFAFAQIELNKHGLKGKVKLLTNCQCPVKRDGTTDTFGCITYQFKFSENGDQIEDNDYSGGNIYNGFGTLNHKRIYKYNAGRQSEVEEYLPSGKLTQRVTYVYDDKGNRTERNNYSPDGKLWSRSTFTYDAKGQRIECTKFNSTGNMTEHFSYSYDAKGYQIMEQHITLSDKKKSDQNNAREATTATDRMMNYVKTFRFDDSGKVISEMDNMGRFSQPFETFFRYAEYDSAGNWLLREDVEQEKIVSTTRRIIEYYK